MERIALVTGGTKGIGKGISTSLLEKGYKVICTYANDLVSAKKFIKSVHKSKREQLMIFQCDLSIQNDLYRLVNFIKGITSHLDCIICNAGCTLRKPFIEISDQDWLNVMQVNVNSNFTLIREFYHMIPNNSRIVFIGSLMGKLPHSSSIIYGVSKAAMHALALNLIKEFEKTDTTINIIVPGFVETGWQQDKPVAIKRSILKKTALGRFAQVTEIVSAVEFCLSNGFLNGSLIEVNGGYNFK